MTAEQKTAIPALHLERSFGLTVQVIQHLESNFFISVADILYLLQIFYICCRFAFICFISFISASLGKI